MNPNETLNRARELADLCIRQGRLDYESTLELAEAVEALDSWLTKGGFLPYPWRRAGAA
jgi:hypothetical protein